MSLTVAAGQSTFAWKFDGTTTPYIGSVSSTTQRGTINYTNPGKYGQALNIQNPSGSTSNSINWNFGTTTFSIDNGFSFSFWVRFNDLSYLTSIQQFITFYNGTSNGLRIQLNATQGLMQFQFQDSVSNKNTNMFIPVSGVWYHLTLVGLAGNITVYVNGTTTYGPMAYVQSGITFNNVSLGLATSFNGYPVTNADFDDLRLYNTALSTAQVLAVYQAQGMPIQGVQSALTVTNITSPTLYSFSSQVFSNAAATSNIGPTQTQLNTAYPTLAPTYLTSNSGIQTWTVPLTGVYQLEAAGAAGGSSSGPVFSGGRGVIIRCQAIFQQNQIISIIAGQKGIDAVSQLTSNVGGGGGGGSFVVDYNTGYLYIAAGGGGGASAHQAGTTGDGKDASYDPNGVIGATSVATGGQNGNGGNSISSGTTGQAGGGGGGFYTNGANGVVTPACGAGGISVLSGAQGRGSANTGITTTCVGGFGCGGGAGGTDGSQGVIISNGAGGGGGGGYSGGGGGCRSFNGNPTGAGGGGSYVSSGQTPIKVGYCTSNGYVSITYLYPVSIQLYKSS